ncbi:hypothetical protein Hokovirus_2_171 [Hokovirus HKV1]|uniref:Uncharacterized protein n=1 Tax=Hokovirus HKV1 TaxID=1977638 RepID=A0A1V0SG75_9VIRU|nr:hypothetical protein Hokovirus_2_171 [Hokovirus HKV1]
MLDLLQYSSFKELKTYLEIAKSNNDKNMEKNIRILMKKKLLEHEQNINKQKIINNKQGTNNKQNNREIKQEIKNTINQETKQEVSKRDISKQNNINESKKNSLYNRNAMYKNINDRLKFQSQLISNINNNGKTNFEKPYL